MTVILCLKPVDWPEPECQRWHAAIQPATFLERASPASLWSGPRQRIVAQAVGQWFAWLQRNDLIASSEQPEERMTEPRIEAFVDEMVNRVSPWSAAMMIGGLKRGYDVLTPGLDLRWLAKICSGLKSEARSSRNKFAHLVSPRQLLELGLCLMERAREEGENTHPYVSTLARDGLMLATLTCFPTRIKNFASMKIGEHLLFQQDRYVVKFGAAEVKVDRNQEGELPPNLTYWIDWYLNVHRRRLLSRGSYPASTWLWVNRSGCPLQDSAIRTQIEARTRAEFGLHLWPHLFRAAAATGLVDSAPEDISVASELLGHASVQTTAKHYILAREQVSHQAVQRTLLAARAEAMARLEK
jgi:site-specific recombinase XerD